MDILDTYTIYYISYTYIGYIQYLFHKQDLKSLISLLLLTHSLPLSNKNLSYGSDLIWLLHCDQSEVNQPLGCVAHLPPQTMLRS